MGVEDGEKMGQYIDLNKKRKERYLKEINPEDAEKTLRIFAEKTVQEFEQRYDTNDNLVRGFLGSINGNSDKAILIELTRAVLSPTSYNETLLYALAKVYQERARRRREQDHADI